MQALHCTQDCTCPAFYAGLCRPRTLRRDVQGLYCTQGCVGPAVYARPSIIYRDVQALNYTQTQGCTGPALYQRIGLYWPGFTSPALYAGLHGPYSVHMGRAALIISAGLCRPCIIYRAVQALDYTEDCIGPPLYIGLYRPCTIPTHRAVLALHYTQDFTSPVLYAGLHGPYSVHMGRAALIISAGLCRPWTIQRTV